MGEEKRWDPFAGHVVKGMNQRVARRINMYYATYLHRKRSDDLRIAISRRSTPRTTDGGHALTSRDSEFVGRKNDSRDSGVSLPPEF